MRLINRLVKDKEEDISRILSDLEHIRTHSSLVNCVFRASGSSWLGVNIAGRSMFPNQTIEIPQYYSTQVLSDDQVSIICHKITQLGFSDFVFHGYIPYFSKIIERLKLLDPAIRILFVFHGFASELSDNAFQTNATHEFIQLYRQQKINKLGLVKAGHELLFERLFAIPAMLLYNKVPVSDLLPHRHSGGKIHIGVLVNESYRKNMHVQVMSALLVENATVHVIDDGELGYLQSRDRIVAHGLMPHKEFLALLASMDINLHVTYSESFGGQVFTESLGFGVPCISGYSNGFLDFDPELKALLSVSDADDPVAISDRIKIILPMRQDLEQRCREYCIMMNKKAEESLQLFLQ